MPKEFKYIFIRNKTVEHILEKEDPKFEEIKKESWDFVLPTEKHAEYPKVGWYFTGACYKHPNKRKFFEKE
ncbi:MAG: hypothetical protein EBU90_24975 [Proteobacteria bacterium]|nr:hypothetical protein [Pseudomonadota bacterium]